MVVRDQGHKYRYGKIVLSPAVKPGHVHDRCPHLVYASPLTLSQGRTQCSQVVAG